MPVHVVTPQPDHTITTPNATMTRLATPSLGTRTLSTWRVHMAPGTAGPLHTVDEEQVWTVSAGALTVEAQGGTGEAVAGCTVVIPPGLERRIHAGDEGAVALVAMPAGGRVTTPAQGPRPLPWAA